MGNNRKRLIYNMAKKICDAYMTYTCSCSFIENNLIDKKVSQKFKEIKDKYIIEIKDFTNVPLDVCLERDSKRENPIGEDIIKGIFNKYRELYNLKETSDEQYTNINAE